MLSSTAVRFGGYCDCDGIGWAGHAECAFTALAERESQTHGLVKVPLCDFSAFSRLKPTVPQKVTR